MREFRTRRKIEFSDTDMAGVVHFSRFFIFMETAEEEFLRALGASFTEDPDGNPVGWPKVEASCDYKSSARYGDDLEIHLRVLRVGKRSVTYGFGFLRDGVEIVRGRTTSVCAVKGTDGAFRAVPLPASLAGLIEEAPG